MEREERIYGIFDGVRKLDSGNESNPLVSIAEWLTIFKKHKVKDISRSQMIMCFALSQEVSKDHKKQNVEDQLLQVLDFYEFTEAVGRTAFLTLSSKNQQSPEKALEAFTKRLGPFIDELGVDYKPTLPPKQKRLNGHFSAFVSGSELIDATDPASITITTELPTVSETGPLAVAAQSTAVSEVEPLAVAAQSTPVSEQSSTVTQALIGTKGDGDSLSGAQSAVATVPPLKSEASTSAVKTAKQDTPSSSHKKSADGSDTLRKSNAQPSSRSQLSSRAKASGNKAKTPPGAGKSK